MLFGGGLGVNEDIPIQFWTEQVKLLFFKFSCLLHLSDLLEEVGGSLAATSSSKYRLSSCSQCSI